MAGCAFHMAAIIPVAISDNDVAGRPTPHQMRQMPKSRRCWPSKLPSSSIRICIGTCWRISQGTPKRIWYDLYWRWSTGWVTKAYFLLLYLRRSFDDFFADWGGAGATAIPSSIAGLQNQFCSEATGDSTHRSKGIATIQRYWCVLEQLLLVATKIQSRVGWRYRAFRSCRDIDRFVQSTSVMILFICCSVFNQFDYVSWCRTRFVCGCQEWKGQQSSGGTGARCRHVHHHIQLHDQRGQTFRECFRCGSRNWPQVSNTIKFAIAYLLPFVNWLMSFL